MIFSFKLQTMLMYFRSLSVMFINNEATATTIAYGPNKNTTSVGFVSENLIFKRVE